MPILGEVGTIVSYAMVGASAIVVALAALYIIDLRWNFINPFHR